METIKRAIFIAAGEGSRMRPVTLETPKPLIKVNGKRMMDRSLEALMKQGIIKKRNLLKDIMIIHIFILLIIQII